MRQLSLNVFSAPDGGWVEDWTPFFIGGKMRTASHGFADLTGVVRMNAAAARRWYRRTGAPHLAVNDRSGRRVWEGRLENVELHPKGIHITAFGYWSAYNDIPYTFLISRTGYDGFQEGTPQNSGNRTPEKYELRTKDALYIAPKKGDTFATGANVGEMILLLPSGGARSFNSLSFDYSFTAPTNWAANWTTYTYNETTGALSSGTNEYTWGGSGVNQTGSIAQSVTGSRNCLSLNFFNNTGAPVTKATETGADFLRITNLRIATAATPITAYDVATYIVSLLNAANPAQVAAIYNLVQDPGVDLTDYLAEDTYADELIEELAKFGDGDGNEWEAAVWLDRALRFQPRGDSGRPYFAYDARIQLSREFSQLRNSVTAKWEDWNDRAVRTTTSDAQSVAINGITRRAMLNTRERTAANVTDRSSVYLAANKYMQPNAKIDVGRIYDKYGVMVPAYMVRAGDTITARTGAHSTAGQTDGIETLLIAATDYEWDTGELSIEPEQPSPAIDAIIARIAKGK